MSYGITAYGTYLPAHRVSHADIGATLGTNAGKGSRVVASFDEDSTTMGVAAAASALPAGTGAVALYFATTTPAYADKTNATAIHAALDLPESCFVVDLAGSARSGVAALRAAAAWAGSRCSPMCGSGAPAPPMNAAVVTAPPRSCSDRTRSPRSSPNPA